MLDYVRVINFLIIIKLCSLFRGYDSDCKINDNLFYRITMT